MIDRVKYIVENRMFGFKENTSNIRRVLEVLEIDVNALCREILERNKQFSLVANYHRLKRASVQAVPCKSDLDNQEFRSFPCVQELPEYPPIHTELFGDRLHFPPS